MAQVVFTSTKGVRYMPIEFLAMLSVVIIGPTGVRYAPMLPWPVKRVGEEAALLVQRQLGDDFHVAAVMVGDEALRALVGPFHGLVELAGGVEDADIFGEDRALHAEGAPDIAGEKAHLVVGHAHRLGEVVALAEHALAAGAAA